MAAAIIEQPELEAAEVLAADPLVQRVILFGSRARGDVRVTSDIDLAVDAPGADAGAWASWIAAMDERRSLVRVDLVLLHEATPALASQIARDGVILFERAP